MCGIVGAVAERNVTAILLEGLKRLEYRGYDSAGVAVYTNDQKLLRTRRPGKVSELEQALIEEPLVGRLGIAHTRWATHGAPCERNAHPHFFRAIWRWCTTASSRTMKPCASNSRLWVMCSRRTPTLKSSRICCTKKTQASTRPDGSPESDRARAARCLRPGGDQRPATGSPGGGP